MDTLLTRSDWDEYLKELWLKGKGGVTVLRKVKKSRKGKKEEEYEKVQLPYRKYVDNFYELTLMAIMARGDLNKNKTTRVLTFLDQPSVGYELQCDFLSDLALATIDPDELDDKEKQATQRFITGRIISESGKKSDAFSSRFSDYLRPSELGTAMERLGLEKTPPDRVLRMGGWLAKKQDSRR